MNWQSIAGALVSAGAPTIGGLLGGPAGGIVGNLVGSLLGQALGVPATPEAVGSAIQTNPNAGAVLQQVEAQNAAHLTELEATVKEMQSARSQTIELAKSGSSIAWGAPVVSTIGLGGFVLISAFALYHGISSDAGAQMIVSTFRDIAIYTVSYWLGSSFGSKQKDAVIAASRR